MHRWELVNNYVEINYNNDLSQGVRLARRPRRHSINHTELLIIMASVLHRLYKVFKLVFAKN